ncbi:GNAT family N-acetyltransferase [Psychrobacter piechaudii]|nr:GNAT family N-acetyltransferase [Psychrobacter piechaudii]
MKTNEVTVKPLTEGDYCDWYKYWQAYLSFYKTSLTEEVTQATWAKILDSNVPIYGFGAFDRTNLVGIAHVVLHPNTWNTTDCCYLEDLYVDGAARGLGIGRALIEKVYQFAEVHNCNRVY